MGEFIDLSQHQVSESLRTIAESASESSQNPSLNVTFQSLFGDTLTEFIVTNQFLPGTATQQPDRFTLTINPTEVVLKNETQSSVTKFIFDSQSLEVNNQPMPASFGPEFARSIDRIITAISDGRAEIYENTKES